MRKFVELFPVLDALLAASDETTSFLLCTLVLSLFFYSKVSSLPCRASLDGLAVLVPNWPRIRKFSEIGALDGRAVFSETFAGCWW